MAVLSSPLASLLDGSLQHAADVLAPGDGGGPGAQTGVGVGVGVGAGAGAIPRTVIPAPLAPQTRSSPSLQSLLDPALQSELMDSLRSAAEAQGDAPSHWTGPVDLTSLLDGAIDRSDVMRSVQRATPPAPPLPPVHASQAAIAAAAATTAAASAATAASALPGRRRRPKDSESSAPRGSGAGFGAGAGPGPGAATVAAAGAGDDDSNSPAHTEAAIHHAVRDADAALELVQQRGRPATSSLAQRRSLAAVAAQCAKAHAAAALAMALLKT